MGIDELKSNLQESRFTKVSFWITGKSTSLVTLSSFILFLVFTAVVLPYQSELARVRSGEKSPDMSFFLTVEEIYDIANSYGEDGRFAYVQARFTFDLVWPIVYTIFLASGISWLFSRAFNLVSKIQLVNCVPVMGMLLDYIENITASIVILRYPERTPIIDLAVVMATPLKWFFVGGSFIFIIIGLVKYVLKVRAQNTCM